MPQFDNSTVEIVPRRFCTPVIFLLFFLGFIIPINRIRNLTCDLIFRLFKTKVVSNGKR